MIRRPASLAPVLVLATIAAPAWAATVEYLHVGASEGSSLGGHAALRVGDEVHHLQHRSPGLLVMHRTDPDTFRWRYGVLQNRTVRAVGLAMPEEAARRLGTRLNQTYLAQRQHLGLRNVLARDRRLLETWLRSEREDEPVAVRGAAAFFEDGERVTGSDGLAAAARAEIAALDPAATPMLPARVEPGVPVPVDGGGFVSERYGDLAERLVALDVLAHHRHVRAGRLVRLDAAPALGATERQALLAFRAHLRRTIARLPGSERPDWGLALLVSLARQDAVEASLASNRLVVVAAPGTPGEIVTVDGADDRAFARDLAHGARRALQAVRAQTLAEGDLTEAGWARLEHAALRVASTADLGRPGAVVRTAPPDATPTAAARVRGLPRPARAQARARAALAQARAAARAWDDVLRAAYGYDLFDRNCVTELVRALNQAGAPNVTARTLHDLGFIPRVSFDRLAASQGAGPVRVRPSYRRRRLAAMRAREPDLLVRLREDNVLTTTIRRATDGEPAFAFFTDDVVLARPLYGVANLAVSTLQTGTGLVAAPFDRASMLARGLRGLVASVPELAFLTVRTGRLRYDRDAGTEAAP